MKIKSLFELLCVVFIIAFGIAIAGVLVWHTFIRAEPELLKGFIGAFMGAFFAFLFIRLAEALTRIYERKTKERSAIISLQHIFNDCFGIIEDDIFICEQYLRSCDVRPDKPQFSIFVHGFQSIPIHRELLLSLLNLDLVNEVNTFNTHARKLNDSMNTIGKMISQVNEAFIKGNIDWATFVHNTEGIKKKVLEIKIFLKAAFDEATRLFAASGVLAMDETTLSKITRILTKSHYSDKQKGAIKEYSKKVHTELSQSSTRDQQRIDNIKSQTNAGTKPTQT